MGEPRREPDAPPDVGAAASAWTRLLAIAKDPGADAMPAPGAPEADRLLELYGPLCHAPTPIVVAHLGQTLDGRIATVSGASRYVTGHEDILHNHRMRALFDAVLVGAGTVRADDPQLTVRRCAGDNPVRVVIDTDRKLGPDFKVFRDGAAETLLLSAEDRVVAGERHGDADVVGLPRRGEGLSPLAVRDTLARRGLGRIFVEGGGITVSRFLAAGCLDRLQITVAPLILGSGRPAILLPEVTSLAEGMRPKVRRFDFGADVMFECVFRDDA